MKTLADCQQLDATDPLRSLRSHFTLPDGVIYLDGNSLGALPKATPARVAEVVAQEWGQGLIRSWNSAHWFTLPQRLGDKIAPLVGAGPGEVVVCDGTSINLFKVLSAALTIAKLNRSPGRKLVLSERCNFPTDLYIAQGLCEQHGFELRLAEADAVREALNPQVAVLMLTQVNYRTGAMHDMKTLTRVAHDAGALAIWDLAHSAGAVPVDLRGADADFAVGCGYKYLNGGPGAPAFVWGHPRHVECGTQPLQGWWSHCAPFEFAPDYRPASGVNRFLCGTQPVLSLAALECGLDVFDATLVLGGMAALRKKSLALTDLFIELVSQRCEQHDVTVATPLNHAQRGSQVSLSWNSPGKNGQGGEGFAIMQALIQRGVIGDFRAGDLSAPSESAARQDLLRFGFAPLYLRFEDVWHAVDHLAQILDGGEWRQARFQHRPAVT